MLLELLIAVSLQGPPPVCDARRAVGADVRQVSAHPDAWLGRCVRVEGYVLGRTFFADVDGFYASEASNKYDRLNDGWLGLYFDGGNEEAWRRLRRATVIGILHDCGRDYEAAAAEAGPGSLVMMTGYCHYEPGLVLRPAQIEPHGPAVFARQVGPEARERIGDLIAGRRPPAAVVDLANRFLTALQARDIAALRGLVALWSEDDPATPEARRALDAFLLGEGESPLASLASVARAPQRAYFLERMHREDEDTPAEDTWHICFCTTGECGGLWPISTIDSTVVRERPYACLIAFNDQFGPEPPDRLAMERRVAGFVELTEMTFRR